MSQELHARLTVEYAHLCIVSGMRQRLCVIGVAVAAIVGPSVTAYAQAPDTRRWEIEFYGGVSAAKAPETGATALPPAGGPIATSSPIFPSRQVVSWFFGDGATLLNDVNASFALTPRVAPLDTAFESPGFEAGARAAFGVRVRRALTARVWAEFGLDTAPASADLPDALDDAAESTRASFESAFGALLSTGPFTNVSIGATRQATSGSRRDVVATAALNVDVTPLRSFVPYFTAGAGVASGTGDAPSMVLEGRYRFSVLNLTSIEEIDRVTVHVERDATFVAVAGGGVRRDVSQRWAFRVDGRLFIGPGGQRLLLDAAPSNTPDTPAGFIESFTHPSVQFSNHASTGRQSSLSAAPVQRFAVFESDGLATRALVTVGLTARF